MASEGTDPAASIFAAVTGSRRSRSPCRLHCQRRYPSRRWHWGTPRPTKGRPCRPFGSSTGTIWVCPREIVPRRDVGACGDPRATQAGLQTRADLPAVELNGVIDGTAQRTRPERPGPSRHRGAIRAPVRSLSRDVTSAPRLELDRLDEPISPELVLVCPELRARALEALPERDPDGFFPVIRTPAPRLEVVGADARPEHAPTEP